MEELIKKLEHDQELAKAVYNPDLEAAYKAANAAVPCDKEEFIAFRKAQQKKADALNKVAKAALEDEKLGEVIFGKDVDAAYAAALKIADGYSKEEFQSTVSQVSPDILTEGYEPPDVELTENDLDRVHSEGLIFIPCTVAVNVNVAANANAAMNANAAINANAVTTANANAVANVNAVANINTGINVNDW